MFYQCMFMTWEACFFSLRYVSPIIIRRRTHYKKRMCLSFDYYSLKRSSGSGNWRSSRFSWSDAVKNVARWVTCFSVSRESFAWLYPAQRMWKIGSTYQQVDGIPDHFNLMLLELSEQWINLFPIFVFHVLHIWTIELYQHWCSYWSPSIHQPYFRLLKPQSNLVFGSFR